MKKLIKLTALLSVLLLATFLISGCGVILVPKDGDTEPGEMETRQYDFTEFTHVDIGSAFEYEIQQADTYSISITANNNVFDDIKITQEGQTLIIGMEIPGAPWAIFKVNPSLKVVITMPQLDGLDSSGATQGFVTSFNSTENLDVTVSGASTVVLEKIAAGDVSGSSKLKLSDLKVKNANVILSGASNGTINLDGSLDAKLSGSSRLVYIGEPALGIMDITGASTLKKK